MPRRRTPPRGDLLPLAYHRYLISARTDGRVSISKDGGYIGSARDIDDAKRIIDDELPRENPPRRKTVDVFLPLPRAEAVEWLRARAIPFTQMREHLSGVAFRIRSGYYTDFRHEKDKSAPRYNPGFTAKEERQYKDILASGARRRYGRRAKEVAARIVLKGRSARRGSKRRNPPKKYETTLNGVHVKFFQGYAEDVRYIREADGKPYSHVVETDAAELYLAEHSVYGRCILIVDPSGKTPLWG